MAVQTVIPEPIGYADAVFNFKRDQNLHGMFFEYANTLQFYNEGYNLIKAEYDENGVEGFMRLIIEFACSDTDAFEEFHVSKLNFSKIEFANSDQCLVSIPIEDDTCFSQFKSRSDQKVNLELETSLDGNALTPYPAVPLTMLLAPKTFILHSDFDQQNAAPLDWTDTITVGGAATIGSAYSIRYIQLGFDRILIDDAGISDQTFIDYATQVEVLPIFIAARTGAYDLDINISLRMDMGARGDDIEILPSGVTPAGMDTWAVEVFIQFNAGIPFLMGGFSVTQDPTGWPPNTSCDPPDSQFYIASNINYNNTNLLTAGDEIKVYARVAFGAFQLHNLTGVNQDYNLCGRFTFRQSSDPFSLSTFSAILETNNGETECEGALVNEALSRTVESYTNDCLRVYSEYFGRVDSYPYSTSIDGEGSLEFLTNGLKIRRWYQKFLDLTAPLLFSFKDLWDGLNPIHNLGMGLESDTVRGGDALWLRIEPSKYFYDPTPIGVIHDKVPDITIRVLAEEHYSIFNGGYQKWEAEEYNGLDEFATKRSYRTSLQNVKNTLNQVSPFIASGYAIEITKGVGRTSKDWRFDNDQFIICVERDNVYYGYGGSDFSFVVEQGTITSPDFLIDPGTVYNFRISPNRNLLRWAWKIFASYNNPYFEKLIFMSGEGNYLAEGKMDNGAEVWESHVLSESEPLIVLKEDIPANGDVPTFEDYTDGMPVYRLEEWSYDFPMSVQDYHLIKANPRGTIPVRYGQNTFFTECYIRRIEFKAAKGIAHCTLLPFVCRQAFATIVMIAIPADGDTFTMTFPETTDEAAWSVTFTWRTVPVLNTDIGFAIGDLPLTGITFNHAVRGVLISGTQPVDDAVRIPYSDLTQGGDAVTQNFFATPLNPYDGEAGNDIVLTWSNAAIFDVASGISLSGGTGSCNIILSYFLLQQNGDFLLQQNGDKLILN